MTNKEKQQITTDVASAVINDIDNTIAEHFCGDVYYTVRNALNDIADKYGVKRNNLADYTWEEIAEIAEIDAIIKQSGMSRADFIRWAVSKFKEQ